MILIMFSSFEPPLLCIIIYEQQAVIAMKGFEPNLSFYEIGGRYFMLMLLGILVGATQLVFLVPLLIIIFITAISGWCPIYQAMGINHSSGEEQ